MDNICIDLSSPLLLCYQQVYMILRPHVKEFLQSMAKIYEVCVHLIPNLMV